MDSEEQTPFLRAVRPRPLDRARALLEVILAGLAGSLLLGPVLVGLEITEEVLLSDTRLLVGFLLAEATLTLIVVFIMMAVRGENWQNLAQRPTTREEFRFGLFSVPLLLLTVIVSGLFFQFFLPHWVTEENPILNLLKEPLDLLLLLLSSILVGGIKEEIQRAFVLIRFEKFLGGGFVGLVFWSLFFGLGHMAQGADNAIRAALLGLVLGLIYLRRRNPTAPIVAHALYDVAVVIFAWMVLT